MKKLLLKTLGLFLLAYMVFLAHRYLLFPKLKSAETAFLDFSYLFNFIATLIIVLTSWLIGCFSKQYLGFIFMAFGVLKLIVFVLWVQKSGFTIDRNLLFHFFIPYGMGLGIDIFFISGQLKDDNPNIVKDLE